MKKFLLTLTFVFLFAGIFTGIASAQNGTPTDDEVNAIAKKLYCPVCESTPLDVCPTEACKDWREQIRQMLADGKTEDEILKYFEEQYGAKVLATPPASGLNWLVYIIPPLLIVAGAVILFRSMKAWTKPQKTAASLGEENEAKDTSSKKDDYVSRLEEELKNRK